MREKKGEIFFGWEGKLSVCRCNWNVFWGQIFNLGNGEEIEEKAKKDRALGKILAEIQRVIRQE